MSAHERTFACDRVDYESTADDLPQQARFLAGDLLRAYASGVEIEEIGNEVTAHLDVLFPVKGRTAEGGRFFSRANLERQRLTRDALEGNQRLMRPRGFSPGRLHGALVNLADLLDLVARQQD